MNVTADEVGPSFEWANASSAINSVRFESGNLQIVVEGPPKLSFQVEVSFENVRAHIVLDEGDLIAFWEAGLSGKNCLVLRVRGGGLLENAPAGFFSVTEGLFSEEDCEWLVMSSDTCVYVISMAEPIIRKVSKR